MAFGVQIVGASDRLHQLHKYRAQITKKGSVINPSNAGATFVLSTFVLRMQRFLKNI